MRIESKSVTPVAAPSTHEARSAKPDPHAPATAPAASVVHLSSAATAATAGADGSNHGLTARLATIKAQLADGSYAVDLDRLSNRIVDDEFVRGKTP